MTDIFASHQAGLESPASGLYAAMPDDTADLLYSSRALNVATSGTVRVTTVAGDEATVFIAAGIAFPIRARRIWATDTTAAGIVVLY